MEQLFNNFSTTLASGYTAGAGSMVLTSATGLPASGTYTLLIRDASTGLPKLLFRAASRSGTTVTGAAEGTDVNANAGDSVLGSTLSVASLTALLSHPTIWSGVGDPNGVLADFGPHDLTSDSSHSPFIVSASSAYFNNPEWLAFDNTATGFWIGQNGGTDFLKLDIGSGNTAILHSYDVRASNSGNAARGPKNWTMQGSNDNSTWSTLHTVTNQTSWLASETRSYTATTMTTAYRYFKLDITANNGDGTYTEVGELYLYSQGTPFGSGVDGDFYVDTSTRKMYGPKNGTAW